MSARAQLASLVLPVTAAVVVPALITLGDPARSWTPWRPASAASAPGWRLALGGAVLAAGLALVAWTIALFARRGRGTLAPWDPPRALVVAGPFAHVRNPMITGVAAIIVGEAVALGSRGIGLWLVVFLIVNHLYFVLSEEPGLARRFGAEYEAYRRHVPRWIPRRRAWRPPR